MCVISIKESILPVIAVGAADAVRLGVLLSYGKHKKAFNNDTMYKMDVFVILRWNFGDIFECV